MTSDAGSRGFWRFPILPPTGRGLRIGLFGGSFNPPHDGHRLASLAAMRRLGLDRVWWIVSPGNPLKRSDGLPSLEARIAAARRVAHHPRIDVTGFEAALGTRYSVETVRYLRRRCPETRFVWIMGADILAELHRWKGWRGFVDSIPIAVVDRPGSTFNATRGRAATVMGRARLRENEAGTLPLCAPPAFVFIHGRRSDASSTRLRAVHGAAPSVEEAAPPESAVEPGAVVAANVVALDRFARKLTVSGAAPSLRSGTIVVSVGKVRAVASVTPSHGVGALWSASLSLDRDVRPDDEVVITVDMAGTTASVIRMPLRAATDATPVSFGLSTPAVDPMTDTVTTVGWIIGGAGDEAVEIVVDGVHVGNAQMRLPRPDVRAHHPLVQSDDLGWRATSTVDGLCRRLMDGERPLLQARLIVGGAIVATSRAMPLAHAGDLAGMMAKRERRARVKRRIEALPPARLLGLLASDAFRRRWAGPDSAEWSAARRAVADEIVRRGDLDRDLRIRLHNGDLVRANPARDAVMARAFLFTGAYERGFLDFLPRLLRSGGTAIDAGAAYGVVTRCLARAGARVVAVEANLRSAVKLERSLSEAGLAAVDVVGKALGERPGELTFAALDGERGNLGASRLIADGSAEEVQRVADQISTLRIMPLHSTDDQRTVVAAGDLSLSTVEVTTLDEICTRHALRDVDLVKMDIEGAELMALRGGEGLWRGAFGRPPVVVLEFSRIVPQLNGSADDIWDFFEARAWDVYVQDAGKGKGGLLKRLNAREEAPIHDNIFCFPPGRRPDIELVAA